MEMYQGQAMVVTDDDDLWRKLAKELYAQIRRKNTLAIRHTPIKSRNKGSGLNRQNTYKAPFPLPPLPVSNRPE